MVARLCCQTFSTWRIHDKAGNNDSNTLWNILVSQLNKIYLSLARDWQSSYFSVQYLTKSKSRWPSDGPGVISCKRVLRPTIGHDGPVRMNACKRLCAAWVSSGVPDMTIILSVVPGRGSCTMTLAPEIWFKEGKRGKEDKFKLIYRQPDCISLKH